MDIKVYHDTTNTEKYDEITVIPLSFLSSNLLFDKFELELDEGEQVLVQIENFHIELGKMKLFVTIKKLNNELYMIPTVGTYIDNQFTLVYSDKMYPCLPESLATIQEQDPIGQIKIFRIQQFTNINSKYIEINDVNVDVYKKIILQLHETILDTLFGKKGEK